MATATAAVTPPSGHSMVGAASVAPLFGGITTSNIPPSSYNASSHPSMEQSVLPHATGNASGNATFSAHTNQGVLNIVRNFFCYFWI